jgi:hypothetical protein
MLRSSSFDVAAMFYGFDRRFAMFLVIGGEQKLIVEYRSGKGSLHNAAYISGTDLFAGAFWLTLNGLVCLKSSLSGCAITA